MTSKPDPFTPDFYDNLDETLCEAWRVLGRGTADRRSPMHTPAVATIGLDGTPSVRTVVLRSIDLITRTVCFHTDRRSAKFGELQVDPHLSIMGYDAGRKIQLRLSGLATLHTQDDLAARAWANSRPMSQACYRQIVSPGSSLAVLTLPPAPQTGGYENFVVVCVSVIALEWLYLAAQGHRRARYTWQNGALSQTWLAP